MASLPLCVWERILLMTLAPSINASPPDQCSTFMALHRHLQTLAAVNRTFYRVCTSHPFLRYAVELIYPDSLFLSPGDERKSMPAAFYQTQFEAWTPARRSQTLRLCYQDYRFLWRSLLHLHRESRCHADEGERMRSYWSPPDDIMLWFLPGTTMQSKTLPNSKRQSALPKEDSTSACCLRVLSQKAVMLLTSSGSSLVLHHRSARADRQSRPPPPPPSPTQADVGMHDRSLLRTHQRQYIFEDIVTIASHLDRLHFLPSPQSSQFSQEKGIPVARLEYESCPSCRQSYPLCGKSSKQRLCGSCLYLHDLHLLSPYWKSTTVN